MAECVIGPNAEANPTVFIQINGVEMTQVVGVPFDIDEPLLTVLQRSRFSDDITVTLTTLTLDEDTIADDAAEDDPVGELEGVAPGSTLEMTDDAGGLFALDGTTVVVADTLTADTYEIEVTETLAGATGSPKASTIEITVTAA